MVDARRSKKLYSEPTANQHPEKTNRLSRLFRTIISYAPYLKLVPCPQRSQGVSVIVRVKDEVDWIKPSILSIRGLADEIIVVDNGSSDGTYEILEELAKDSGGIIKLWKKPKLNILELNNFALANTSYRWIFKWDGDMVAHTTGENNVSKLRRRILSLDPHRYYLIYLQLINLAGDLRHQDATEIVHIEEYAYTFSPKAIYVQRRYEAVKFPKYYKPLFWYEPYAFHVNIKPSKRLLFRHLWECWLNEQKNFPEFSDYVPHRIEREFGTRDVLEAQQIYFRRTRKNYIPYNQDRFGPYPELLRPYVDQPKYQLIYRDNEIVGRIES